MKQNNGFHVNTCKILSIESFQGVAKIHQLNVQQVCRKLTQHVVMKKFVTLFVIFVSICSVLSIDDIYITPVNGKLILFNGMNNAIDLEATEQLCNSIGGELVGSIDDVMFLRTILPPNGKGVWLERLPASSCPTWTKCCGSQARTSGSRSRPTIATSTNACSTKAYQACRMTSLPSKEVLLKLDFLRRSDDVDAFLANVQEHEVRINVWETSLLNSQDLSMSIFSDFADSFSDPKESITSTHSAVTQLTKFRDEDRYEDALAGCQARIDRFSAIDSSKMTEAIETVKIEMEVAVEKSNELDLFTQLFETELRDDQEQSDTDLEKAADSLTTATEDHEYIVKEADIRMGTDLDKMKSVSKEIVRLDKQAELTKQAQKEVEQLKLEIGKTIREVEGRLPKASLRLDFVDKVPEAMDHEAIKREMEAFQKAGYRQEHRAFVSTVITFLCLMVVLLIVNSVFIYRSKLVTSSPAFQNLENENFEG